MTYLEAAYNILTEANEPLHYADITQLALDRGLITPTGLTPEATMGSRLYTDTKQELSQFIRIGKGVFDLVRRRLGGIDDQVQEINRATRERLHELLYTIPADRFEALIMDLLLQMGFDENTVMVTPYQGDGGIDVIGVYRAAGLTEVNAAVQVKRWKRNVQAPTVTQLRGSLQVHQQGIIITTSDFSAGARKEASAANKTRIGMINGSELLDLLIKHRVGVVEKTLTVTTLDDEWWGELVATHTQTIPAPPSLPIATPAIVVHNHQSAHVADVETIDRNPTGQKPKGFTLLGQNYNVVSWKALLVQVCGILAQHHAGDFGNRVTTLRGRKRQYIADHADGMINPAPIAGTQLWIETNLSASDILKLTQRMLAIFGHPSEEFYTLY